MATSIEEILLRVNTELGGAEADVAALAALLERLDGKNATSDVDVRTAGAEAEVAALQAALDHVDGQKVTAHADLNDAGALSKAAALDAVLEILDHKKVKPNVDLGSGAADIAKDISSAFEELGSASDTASSGAKRVSLSIGNMTIPIGVSTPMVAALAAVIIGALVAALGMLVASAGAAVAALGALAAAVAGLLGPVLLFGLAVVARFTQILKAKTAQDQASTAEAKKAAGAGASAAQADEQRRAATEAVRNAREQLTTAEREHTRAVTQAKQAIQDAARTEAKAQEDVAVATRDLARAQDDLKRARQDAGQAITDASKSAADAQQALQDAETTGARDVANAQDAVVTATQNVADQTVAANRAIADSFRQVRDATLSVKEATLNLSDAQDKVSSIQDQIKSLLGQMGSADPGAQLSKLKNVDLSNFDAGTYLQSQGMQDDAGRAAKLKALLDQLAHANLDTEKATNSLADAQQNLADAQAQNTDYIQNGINAYKPYTDAVKAQQAAEQSLQDVQQRSARAIADASATYADAQAKLAALQKQGIDNAPAVISAVDHETDARRRLHDARITEAEDERKLQDLRRAGVQGSEQVISANERLRNAHQSLADAIFREQHLQAAGGGGGGGISSQAAGAAVAVGKLSAAEREMLSVIRELLKSFRDMTSGGTDAFFRGLAQAIRIIIPVMGELRPMFTDLGKAAGAVAVQFAKFLAQPANVRFFQQMGEAAAQVIRILGGPVFENFFKIVRNIATAAMPFLIDGLRQVGKLMGVWAQGTQGLTAHNSVMKEIMHSLGSWVGLMMSLIHLFSAFVVAVAPIGDELVKWLAKGAEYLARWISSSKGTAEIKQFFQDSLPLVKEVIKALGLLFLAFMILWERAAPVLAVFARVINTAFSALIRLFYQLTQAERPIVQFLVAVLNKVADVLDSILNFLPDFVMHFQKYMKQAADFIDSAISDGIKAGGAAIAAGARWIAQQFMSEITSGKSVFTNIGNWITDRLADGIKTVTGLFSKVGNWVYDRINDFLTAEGKGFLNIGSWIINRLADGITTITGAVRGIGRWVKDRVDDLVSAEARGLVNIGTWIINRLADGITTVTNALGGIGGWVKNRVSDIITGTVGFFGVGNWIISRVGDGITTVVDSLKGIGGWVLNRVSDFITGTTGFYGVGTWVIGKIADGLSNFGAIAKSVYDSLGNLVNNIIRFIKNKLGIHSPSREFQYIGEMMMKGLANGISGSNILGVISHTLGGIKYLAFQLIKEGIIDVPKKFAKSIFNFFGKDVFGGGIKAVTNFLGGLAEGGLVTGPVVKVLGESGDNEAVLPLTTDVFKKLAEGITRALSVGSPMFAMPGIASPTTVGGPQAAPTIIEQMHLNLPPVQPDQSGADPRQSAALLMQELRARGMSR